MRCLILLCLLACGLPVRAQVAAAPAAHADAVHAILHDIDPARPETVTQAEERLARLGGPALEAMRAAYDALLPQRTEAEQAGRWPEVWRLDAQLTALDQEIVRLEAGYTPPEVVAEWLQQTAVGEHAEALRTLQLLPLTRIADDRLTRAFPEYYFYLKRFPRYPLARLLPAPLGTNNLFAVKREKPERAAAGLELPPDQVILITEADMLKKFFLAHAQPIIRPHIRMTPEGVHNGMKAYAYSWLRLSAELHNDGFFRFRIPAEGLQVAAVPGNRQVTGRAEVIPTGGNAGRLTAVLTFDGGTQLAGIEETVELEVGIRPR